MHLYNIINFDAYSDYPFSLEDSNRTAALTKLAFLLCPSDPRGLSGPYGSNNYRGNIGLIDGCEGRRTTGAFLRIRPARIAHFVDGTGTTILFSEKPIGSADSGSSNYSPFRDWLSTADLPHPCSADGWLRVCSSKRFPHGARLDSGGTWLIAGAIYTHFYVSAPPNSRVPDCGNKHLVGTGVFAARSYHPGGVNAVMVDGSVHWFASSIDIRVWQALGTRNGRELINHDGLW
jgi:prepilin-type processing-associated H-X9-DG protein